MACQRHSPAPGPEACPGSCPAEEMVGMESSHVLQSGPRNSCIAISGKW